MKLAAALTALLALPAGAQQTAGPLTLDDAVSLAVGNSPAALAAEQDVIIARQRVREARFMELPQITFSGTATRASLQYPVLLGAELGERYLDPAIDKTLYTLRAQALQPVYTGGRNTNTIKMARAAHNQAKLAYEAARAQAALDAKKAFYSLLYQRRLAALSAGWLKRAGAISAAVRKDAYEEIEASMLLSSLADRARQAAAGEEAATAELLRVISREPGGRPELAGDFAAAPVDPDVRASLVTAVESRPELKGEVYRAQMDDIAVNMAMVKRYPTVYLGASYDVNADNVADLSDDSIRSKNWVASLAIHFPLSYDVWTQVQQRRAQQRQGELARLELQEKVRSEVLAAHKEALLWEGEAARLAAETARLRDAYDAAGAAARPGMSALRAFCALCDMEHRAADAVYEQLAARARLEWARGADLKR